MGDVTQDRRAVGESAVTVAAFYKFVAIDDPAALRDALMPTCIANGVMGTILIAGEGLNATVSASADGIKDLLDVIFADEQFRDIEVKYSHTTEHPFQRLKVKIKPEIVTFGAPSVSPDITTGQAVEPEDWNALIAQPDVVLIDTRNDYEVEIGSFPGAINPETRAFGEFPEFVERRLKDDLNRPIAMFCTGGIRCEKASAYLLSRGFTNVYQLRGGILRYLERVAPAQSQWQGECFVFDERVAVAEGLRQGQHGLCAHCGRPVKMNDQTRGDVVCDGVCETAPHRHAEDVL